MLEYRQLKPKNKAFTLAEVLITLTVIGIIGALTIPALIQSINNADLETKLKSDISYISQAFNMISVDYGGDVSGAFGNTNDTMLKAFENKMVFVKTCLSNQYPGVCWHDGTNTWKNLYGNNGWIDLNSNARAILNNGSMIAIGSWNSGCTSNKGNGPLNYSCGYLYIDVNGFKGPNTTGRDIFRLHITNSGIYPTGSNGDGYSDWNEYCNKTNATNDKNGLGCATKILQGGHVDN